MIIHVTQADLDRTDRGAHSCPVAVALNRQSKGYDGQGFGVTHHYIAAYREGKPQVTIPTSMRLRRNIEELDKMLPVKPFSFRLILPLHGASNEST